jgi:hypothetical protein
MIHGRGKSLYIDVETLPKICALSLFPVFFYWFVLMNPMLEFWNPNSLETTGEVLRINFISLC